MAILTKMLILAKNPQSLTYKSNEEAKRPFLKVAILTKTEACVAVVSVSFRPSGVSTPCFFRLAPYTKETGTTATRVKGKVLILSFFQLIVFLTFRHLPH